MSSLAATQADGYYVPVEYYEGGAYKKQSKNQFNATNGGNNKGRKRGSGGGGGGGGGHNQWLQNGVVRFELPHQGHCLGPNCTQIAIGQGTRYNAKKLKTDQSYFTTPIYEFRLKCRVCSQPWIICTNPADRCFDYVSGIKRQSVGDGGTGADARSNDGDDDDDIHDDDNNPLSRLETAVQGKSRAVTELEELQELVRMNEASCGILNDADNNARIRKSFRKDRNDKKNRIHDATKLGWRAGMELLPSTSTSIEDIVSSKEAVFGKKPHDIERHRMSKVRRSSIFDKNDDKTKRIVRRRRSTDSSKDGRSSSSCKVRPDHVSSLSSSQANSDQGSKLEEGGPRKRKIRISGKASVVETQQICNDELTVTKDCDRQRAKVDTDQYKPINSSETSSSLNAMFAGYGSSDDDHDDAH